jgi:hypothetical protein
MYVQVMKRMKEIKYIKETVHGEILLLSIFLHKLKKKKYHSDNI